MAPVPPNNSILMAPVSPINSILITSSTEQQHPHHQFHQTTASSSPVHQTTASSIHQFHRSTASSSPVPPNNSILITSSTEQQHPHHQFHQTTASSCHQFPQTTASSWHQFHRQLHPQSGFQQNRDIR